MDHTDQSQTTRCVLIAPTLGPDVIATAQILEKAGLLQCLVTRGTIGAAQRDLLQRSALTRPFSRRPQSPVSSSRIETHWLADVLFSAVKAITRSRLKATDVSFAYVDRIAAKRIELSIKGVFAREDCCVRTFGRAKELGLKRIYQLPTVYWKYFRDLIERETARFPGICRAAEDQSEFALARTERKTSELELADYILCPSTFVRSSLPSDRLPAARMIPFAIDVSEPEAAGSKSSKPVFLYVGNITMRKGVHRLLLAWKELQAYRTHELRLVGDMFLSDEFLSGFLGMFTHVPRVSRAELDRHYREASALVFNSVADGFGHVILESMAVGTPVLASRNSGAPDVIKDHVDGLLFDYGNEEQFVTALNWALSRPAELAGLGKAATEAVRKRTWNDYGKELLDWLGPVLA